MSLADLHFLRPWWLLGFVALAAALWLHGRNWQRRSGWLRVCDPRLLPHVLGEAGVPRRDPFQWLAGSAAALLLLALAGPTWERLPQPVFRDTSALVIALDLSRSMDATDIKPSRAARARFEIADLVAARRSGMTALVVYAAGAFTVTPLTDDYRTITAQLPVLATELMPAQGSRADLAVERAVELLRRSGLPAGDVILVTDGVTPREIDGIEATLADARLRLSILGVGTLEGAPVPGPAGHLTADNGQPVIARLDPGTLEALARRGGGVYRTVTADDSDLRALLATLGTEHAIDDSRRSELLADQWRELGPWLVAAAVPFAALLFRRGIVLALFAALVLPWPRPAAAVDWADLWRNPDQRAAQLLEQAPAQAADLFRDPAWKGAAQYRAGDYQAAVESLRGRDDALSLYNRGNARARMGDYEAALADYEEALARDPGDADARHNRDLVRQLLEQQSQGAPSRGPPGDREQQADGEDAKSDPDPAQPPPGSAPQEAESRGGQGEQPAERTGTDDPGSPQAGSDPTTSPATAPRKEEESADASGAGEQAANGTASSQEVPGRETPDAEQMQAAEQWLRRIPDDPGGLLRRKFLYQYRQLGRQAETDTPW